MGKLPQDFAFPLGLGTKRYQQQNGDGPLPNSIDATSNQSRSAENRRPSHDLDTINL